MASVYPGALDAFATDKTNATVAEDDHPGHHNDLADAVNKIEAELGVNPSGAAASVADRLAGSLFTFEQSHYAGWSATDVATGTGFDWDSTLASGNELLDLTGSTTNPTFLDTAALYHIQVYMSFNDEDVTKFARVDIYGNASSASDSAALFGPGAEGPTLSTSLLLLGSDSLYVDLVHDYGAGLTVAGFDAYITKLGGS